MNFFEHKHQLYNIFGVVTITLVMGYFVVTHNATAKTEPVKFVNLTDSDINTILAVKAEMQQAQIQAGLDD